MIIHDLDILGAGGRPAKAQAKLVVDADAVLAGTAALQGFQTVARRYAQVVQPFRDLQLPQLAPRYGGDVGEPLDGRAVRQGLRVGALEGFDHRQIVTQCVINVKRDYRGMSGLPLPIGPDGGMMKPVKEGI